MAKPSRDDPEPPKPEQSAGAKKNKHHRERYAVREAAIKAAGVRSGKASARREKKLEALLEAAERSAADFDVLGDPPLDDPELGLAYARRAQLIALGQVLRSRELTPWDRWKLVRELATALGQTHSKSALETRMDAAERKLLDRREAAAGAVRMEPASRVAKPATARGAARGPRAVAEPPVAEKDTGEPPDEELH